MRMAGGVDGGGEGGNVARVSGAVGARARQKYVARGGVVGGIVQKAVTMTRILVSALTTAVRRREWFFRCWCNAADDAERARLQERDDHAELLIMRLEEHIVRGLEKAERQ